MSVIEDVRTRDEERVGSEVAEHPAGDLDTELEQLRTLESLVKHAYASCTNSTVACSGGLCCM